MAGSLRDGDRDAIEDSESMKLEKVTPVGGEGLRRPGLGTAALSRPVLELQVSEAET